MAEIQSTISSRELRLWGLYRKKFGPLNPVRKYDAGAALICSQINRSNGGKATPKDFMPYGQNVDSEGNDIVDADTFMKLLSAHPKARIVR